ncbi:uncharacterized protein LOC114258839 isoform X4 [Camellia sinensis]|uniref:uncharacterized protein LOC114258839 isoform X4 n=1 Tax=Camellia sinensis TaxID=4442 RepID=UPI0010358652|nr:uncharacterized protein LOC114258839 isoform X4 [Camellia sinensis]
MSFLTSTRSHWQVHMDLRNIEMVGGNGQLLLVSHHLLDINMLQFLLMRGSMFLEVHLVVDLWWRTHQVLQSWILQQESGAIQNLLLLLPGQADKVLMLLVEMLKLS